MWHKNVISKKCVLLGDEFYKEIKEALTPAQLKTLKDKIWEFGIYMRDVTPDTTSFSWTESSALPDSYLPYTVFGKANGESVGADEVIPPLEDMPLLIRERGIK